MLQGGGESAQVEERRHICVSYSHPVVGCCQLQLLARLLAQQSTTITSNMPSVRCRVIKEGRSAS
jgi:hypothetical protein